MLGSLSSGIGAIIISFRSEGTEAHGVSGKEPACQYRRCKRHGSILGLGRSPREEHGNILQCSCLENPMDRRAWWAIVHGVAMSQTQLKQLSRHTCIQRLAMDLGFDDE